MRVSDFKIAFLAFASLANGIAHSAVKGTGSTTRGWSCCKNSCSWSNKAPVNSPVISCDARDNLGVNPARRDGCDSGGGSFACSDLSPWAKSNDLAYGFAGVNLVASNETAWCCSCYSLTFTSGSVNGKKMIVQVVNTGNDLGDDQFDLAIPGGGQGATRGCSTQFGGPAIWGAEYGGIAHRDECDAFPEPLKAGCYWRFDWFRNADNPTVNWEKVSCPQDLSYVSGCRRNDDPIPGQSTSKPVPSPTSSAPLASGTVQQGGQCGGRNYRGPTVCVAGTVCTFYNEDTYYCLPDPASTRSTPVTTKPTPVPTIAQPWDQCGGQGFTGPSRCKDSTCRSFDQWWWQCIPASNWVPPASSAPPPVVTSAAPNPGNPNPGWPGWTFTRPHVTWPGQPQPPAQTPTRPGNPPPSSTRPNQPTGTIAQLYDQCGGMTYQGPTRCAQGLSCIYVDDYYSQCQRPNKKSPKFKE